jgi:hypothetical protein
MRSTAILAILSFATGGHAWAQAANGEWIANMDIYDVTNSPWSSNCVFNISRSRQSQLTYHIEATDQACTYRNTNNRVPIGAPCKYWLDGNGRIAEGGE